MSFPQYAKSEHPEVLASIRETRSCRAEYNEKFLNFVKSLGLTTPKRGFRQSGWEFCALSVTGIAVTEQEFESLPGKWIKPSRGVTRPQKSNPLYKEFSALGMKAAPIPGRGTLQFGQSYMGTGALFEHEGAVYSHIDFTPAHQPEHDQAAEYGWQEILGSEFHTALEAYKKEQELSK